MIKKVNTLKKFLVLGMIVMTCFGPAFTLASPQPPEPPKPPKNTSVMPEPPTPPNAPQIIPDQTPTQPTINQPVTPTDSVVTPTQPTSGGAGELDTGNTVSDSVTPQLNVAEQNASETPASQLKSESTTNDSSIDNTNNATLENNVVSGSDTGNNKSSRNTGFGSVVTGASNFVLNFVNMINSNFITLPGGRMVITFKDIYQGLIGDYIINPVNGERYSLTGARLDDVSNSDTGANSNNSATVDQANNLDVTNNNKSGVVNNFDLSSSTGNNKANENTGDGSVSTGDANLSFSLLNFINTNFTVGVSGLVGVINIFGDWTGNLVIPKDLLAGILGAGNPDTLKVSNENAGANSTNTAQVNESNNLAVQNNNQADVANNVSVGTNTGNNEADRNTGDSAVTSGGSSTALNISNSLNKNIFGDTLMDVVVNVMGAWSGLNLLPQAIPATASASGGATTIEVSNLNTGAGSENKAAINSENNTTVSNNNNAALVNNVKANSNTGNNDASENTGSGSISTGNARLAINIANFINTNITANRLVYLVINVFGNWKGNITDTPTAAASGSVVNSGTESNSTTQTITENNGIREYTWTSFRALNNVSATNPNFDVAIQNVTDNPDQLKKIVLASTDYNFGSPDGTASDGVGLMGLLTSNITKIFLVLFILYIITAVIYLISSKRKSIKQRRIL